MHKAVIGLGFGDEGKGITTDFLSSRPDSPRPLNVRFSGGHQVGHTVVTDTFRHVFSNFGAGTRRGVPTYWSPECTVCPVGIMNELIDLRKKGLKPKLYLNMECPVVTYMDMMKNHANESLNNHGSTGVGFGATIQREEDFYSLKVADLSNQTIMCEKMRNIVDYYGGGAYPVESLGDFVNAVFFLHTAPEVEFVYGPPAGFTEYIFEGSQGLLLDQHYGFFPNVTRSNTGSVNLAQYKDEMAFYLVTRAYQTRHGAGFMTNETYPHKIRSDERETNVLNYQGEFRRSLLDVSLLEYAISRDKRIRESKLKRLVITCLDHVEDDLRFTYAGKIYTWDTPAKFAEEVAKVLTIRSVYTSFTPHSFHMKEILL